MFYPMVGSKTEEATSRSTQRLFGLLAPLENRLGRDADSGRCMNDICDSVAQGCYLGLDSRALTRNNCHGMPHALASWRRCAHHQSTHRLAKLFFDIGRRFLFLGAAYLAYEDNQISAWIVVE